MTALTAPAPPPAPPTVAPRARLGYWKSWRRVPRELGFLLPTLLLALIFLSVVHALFSTAISLVWIFVGVFVAMAIPIVARAFGAFERRRLELAGFPPIEAPPAQPPAIGFWPTIGRVLGDAHGWIAALYFGVVNIVIAGLTFAALVAVLSISLDLVAQPILAIISTGTGGWYVPDVFESLSFANGYVGLRIVLAVVLGGIALWALPYVTHGLTALHHLVAAPMLGRWRTESLEAQVSGLETSRAAAVQTEDAAIRRIERDIHDGPQQRLVRMQMDLATADRRMADGDPAGAQALIAEAMEQSREALAELRALSRGFAPPILLDRGLVAAVEALAIRSVLPVEVVDGLDERTFAPELERNAYFIASELVTNAAKHSGASHVTVTLSTTDAAALVVEVVDDGRGGAAEHPGHGLAGIRERLLGLGGSLAIDSPAGGPTRVTGSIPTGVAA